jgi:DNA invertase Pin-like site-specific DNA recombinase
MSENGRLSNAVAAQEADALIEASVALRRELVVYERQVRRMRSRVMKGRPTPAPAALPELIAVRIRVNERFDELERRRRRWRTAYFRLQADGGMSYGAIAREWGLSRQLVSRLMSDASEDAPSG